LNILSSFCFLLRNWLSSIWNIGSLIKQLIIS
jgi:hypothetical protein